MGTRGQVSSLGWGKIFRERGKFGNMSGDWWGICLGETSVWCDAVDGSLGCVLVFTSS